MHVGRREGRISAENHERDHSEGPQIGLLAIAEAPQYFGGDVVRRPDDRLDDCTCSENFGQSEVANSDV